MTDLQLDIFYIGDVLEKLKLIPDKSVRCCVTSPPYYGLRDYNTATWSGGDESCDHKPSSTPTQRGINSSTLQGGKKSTSHQQEGYKNLCSRCGAIRTDNQIGLEDTPEKYIEKLVAVFREIKRILTDDGTLWLNIADSYWGGKGTSGAARSDKQQQRNANGESLNSAAQSIGKMGWTRPADGKHDSIKPKDLIGIPWMLSFALQGRCVIPGESLNNAADLLRQARETKDWGIVAGVEGMLRAWSLACEWLGPYWLRSDIIWAKPNPMPESVTDRPTKSHEYIFLLTKSSRYYYDAEAIRQPLVESLLNDINVDSANKKTVWAVSTKPFAEAHFATFPEDLIVDCIKAGTSEHGQCGKCGSAYVRITKTKKIPRNELPTDDPRYRPNRYTDNKYANEIKEGYECGMYSTTATIGWKATCNCQNASIVPDVVIDPFSGAGTTALQSKKLNRNFIAVDINKHYVAMSVERLKKELGAFYQPKMEVV